MIFEYSAQTTSGHTLRGDIRAEDGEEARAVLADSGLVVTDLTARDAPQPSGALSGSDFQVFNEQFAFLADAGLPASEALQVIATDVRRGRLATTIQSVRAELERGASLSDAFNKHRGQFPYGYAELIDAGIASGNLPGVLWGLSRHLEMRSRLSTAVWRATAYPVVVMLTLLGVWSFIGIAVAPQFDDMFSDFDTQPPAITTAMLTVAEWGGVMLVVGLVVLLGGPLLWRLGRPTGIPQWLSDTFIVPLPIVGPAVRAIHVARWCDSVRLGVLASLPLPETLKLAWASTDSPSVRRDCASLTAAVASGKPLDDARLRLLPAPAVTTLSLASDGRDLAGVLSDLSALYANVAETRLNAIHIVLSPLLLIMVAVILGLTITALFAPLIKLLQSVM
ncbi:MAG: type II secretion system F family protein [Planctomycetota bacterium]